MDEMRYPQSPEQEWEYESASPHSRFAEDEARADDPLCGYCNLRLSEHESLTPWCEGQALALPRRREKLRRAAEDGERLYRVRMHAPDGPTIADDNRIDGILSLELLDALGLVDQLVEVAEAASLVAAFHQAGGAEWWQAHSRLYEALNKLGIETPYAR